MELNTFTVGAGLLVAAAILLAWEVTLANVGGEDSPLRRKLLVLVIACGAAGIAMVYYGAQP